jgi:hypothetical protein
MATRSETEIELSQALGIRNIFVKDWKLHFFTDGRKRIASIPFMRNLIEYTHGIIDRDYLKLTSLLHWQPSSASVMQQELDAIYARLFGENGESFADANSPVIDFIQKEAVACLSADAGVNFEHKIVLSIATRLTAERFMTHKVSDPPLSEVGENQTQELLKRFRTQHKGETAAIRTLRSVVLMTPENIHLNAFMYEPILDMSDEHLRRLYRDVSALNGAAPKAPPPSKTSRQKSKSS